MVRLELLTPIAAPPGRCFRRVRTSSGPLSLGMITSVRSRSKGGSLAANYTASAPSLA